MIMIPENFRYNPKPKHTCHEGGSTHSPVSVSHFWITEKGRVPAIQPLATTEKHVTFAPTVRVREFRISPPLSPLEESDVWYSKRDFAIFSAENKVLTKAIRLGSRTGNQKVRPEVPELRGLEDHLSIRANLEAKGRHNRALTAVFIEQERQQSDQRADPEAIREASLKVTRQSLDIALYRGKMDHQRCMMPTAARFGSHSPVTRKTIEVKVEAGDIVKPSLTRTEIHKSVPRVDKTPTSKFEAITRQRPGIVSQSSLRFREAMKSKDKSPAPPKRASLQTPRKPEVDSPSAFAVGKPRRGRIVVKP